MAPSGRRVREPLSRQAPSVYTTYLLLMVCNVCNLWVLCGEKGRKGASEDVPACSCCDAGREDRKADLALLGHSVATVYLT